jgi:hypothetical protein
MDRGASEANVKSTTLVNKVFALQSPSARALTRWMLNNCRSDERQMTLFA